MREQEAAVANHVCVRHAEVSFYSFVFNFMQKGVETAGEASSAQGLWRYFPANIRTMHTR